MLVQSLYETSDHRPDLDFATAATVVCREMAQEQSQLCAERFRSPWSEHFSLMLFAGFFVQTGGRYQMTIPGVIDIKKVHDRLSDWLKRMDQENLSPNDLFVTLTERDAKSWEARLRHMDVAARVADRAILLDGSA